MINKSLGFLLLLSATAAAGFSQNSSTQGVRSGFFSMMFSDNGGYLGVETRDVSKENFAKYGLKDVRGVAVEKVTEGSPAQAAGLQSGDVITSFDGESVTSVRKLSRLITEVAPDHQAKLTVLRNGEPRDLTVTLGKRPTPTFGNGSFSVGPPSRSGRVIVPEFGTMPGEPSLPPITDGPPSGETLPPGAFSENLPLFGRVAATRRIGAGISPLTPQLAEYFGVTGGVLVNAVRADSPAARAGLKAGDIIIEADGKPVKSNIDLIRTVAEKTTGDVSLLISRNRARQTIRVTPETVTGSTETLEFPDMQMAPGQMAYPMRTVPMTLNELSVPGRVL